MTEPTFACACAARPGDGTHAVAVDPEIKHRCSPGCGGSRARCAAYRGWSRRSATVPTC